VLSGWISVMRGSSWLSYLGASMGPSTDVRLSPSEKNHLGLGTRIAGKHELRDLPSLSYMHVGIKERRLLLYRGLMMSCCRNKKGGRVAWYKSIECSNQRSLFAKFSTWKGLVSSWSGVLTRSRSSNKSIHGAHLLCGIVGMDSTLDSNYDSDWQT